MVKYIWDAINYDGNTWGHAIVGTIFEFSAIFALAVFFFFIYNW